MQSIRLTNQEKDQKQTVLPDSAIYRQFRDFGGWAGDKIFAKIARDFCQNSRDFKKLLIFGEFPAISRKILAISAIFELSLTFQKSQFLHFFLKFQFENVLKNFLEKVVKSFYKFQFLKTLPHKNALKKVAQGKIWPKSVQNVAIFPRFWALQVAILASFKVQIGDFWKFWPGNTGWFQLLQTI